jgi:hypothetical protein
MAVSIQNPTKCEVRGVIRFLHAKGETAAVMNRRNVANGVVNLKQEEMMFMMK